MAIAYKVKSIIVAQLGVAEEAVTMEASLVDDLGADERDLVEIIMAFEEAFGILIPDEDPFFTVREAIDYLQGKLAEQS